MVVDAAYHKKHECCVMVSGEVNNMRDHVCRHGHHRMYHACHGYHGGLSRRDMALIRHGVVIGTVRGFVHAVALGVAVRAIVRAGQERRTTQS